MRIALVILFAWSLIATRAAAAAPTPAEIDRACDATERRATAHKNEARIFGSVPTNAAGTQAAWRRFSSAQALATATPDGPPDEQASVWPAVAGRVFVEMFFTSRSGDWAQFADLCYQPDGTLARSIDTLNTFNTGDDEGRGVSRVHTLYFDAAGQIIHRRSKLVDLQTHQAVKRAFADQEDQIFKRLTDLPFSDLLPPSRK